MATQTQNRRQAAPQLRLTSAKIRTLEFLAEYFCLRTKDIAELIRNRTPNESDIRTAHHTLNLLHLGGLVNRIPYLDLDLEGGGRTYAYGLSDKGVEFCKSLWPLCKTFDEHSQRTLDHELEISFFDIALKKVAVKNGLSLYWQQSDLKHTISPDTMFALTDPAKPEGKNTKYYFLEIERAKIGHYIKGEPSIMRKLAKYYDYYGTDLCEKEWLDFRQYRVIVVQRTAERMKNLLKELATQEIHKDNCPSRKGKNCNCKPRTLDHRMFWLSSESAYRENIGGRIFATPKDYAGDNYSFLET